MLRRACLAVPLFALGFIAVAALSDPPPATGQDKKVKQDLKQELTKAEKQIAALQAEIREGKALVASLQADLKKEAAGDTTNAKTIQNLTAQLTAIRGATYVHTSTWKKKADASDTVVQVVLRRTRPPSGAGMRM